MNTFLRYPDEIEKIIEKGENFVERIIFWLQEEFFGPSKIVFGIDYPFAANQAPFVTKDFEKYDGFSEKDFDAINYLNSFELFLQLERP